MKQKILALVLVAALLGAFLVGCSSKPAETAAPASDAQTETSGEQSENTESTDGTGITLKWQQWWQVECPDGYVEALVEEYEKQTGVHIELLSAPFADTKVAITAGASTGTMADIVSVYGTWVYEFANQGILANMSELMEADGFDRSTIASEWQVLGETYALPIINFAYPMYANQDILDEAGVTSLPATWSEFEDACAKIKAAGYYPFAISLDTTSPTGIQNSWMGFAWGSGIKMQAEDGTYRVAGNEGLAEFSEYIKELYDKGYIYPGMSALTEAEMSSKFCAGEIAFHINSTALLPSYRTEAPDMNITAMPVPVKDGYTDQQGVGVASWALGISEQSEHKAEAMKFIEYLLAGLDGKDGSVCADLSVIQAGFPNSTIAEPDYGDADKAFLAYFDEYMNRYPINEFNGMKEATTIMVDYIDEVTLFMEGDKDVAAYLDALQQDIDDIYEN